jgi:LPPG:FO 2-phospho-L-lactate transferase
MRVTALAGGTGSAKLLRGLASLDLDLRVVANVGDNVWMYGAYVCPDVDIACYTLAGVSDRTRGWGIEGDTFEALRALSRLGIETWFRLGDQDLAVCMARTEMMRRGMTLTEATESIRKSLGVRIPICPASDRHLETRVSTSKGELHLQEFWVREEGKPSVQGVRYKGATSARTTKEVRSAILRADRIVVCPANPVTSIGPMLAIPGFARLLRSTAGRVVALSPMAGVHPISGPAGRLLKATGRSADSVGVAESYSGFLDAMVISRGDSAMRSRIEKLGVECKLSDTFMKGPDDERRLAEELLKA